MKDTCFGHTLTESVARGKKGGLFRKEIDTLIITKMRMVQVEAGFNPDIFPTGEFDISDVQMQLFDHFVFGITTKKGRELFEKYSEEIQTPN
jgi:hypothetical protein